MGKFSDEVKRLTLDPGARRLGEIADQLESAIEDIRQQCCGGDVDVNPPLPSPSPPSPLTEPGSR